MKILSPTVILILIATLAVAGCTSQPSVPVPTTVSTPAPVITATPTPALPAQFEGQWVLRTFGIQNGAAVTYPTTEITLVLNRDGTLSGWGGCNNYFGSYTLNGMTTPKGDGMLVTTTGSTKKYCQDYSAQEDQYLAILGKTAAYSGDGTLLTLTASTGDSLGFKRSQVNPNPTWDRGY